MRWLGDRSICSRPADVLRNVQLRSWHPTAQVRRSRGCYGLVTKYCILRKSVVTCAEPKKGLGGAFRQLLSGDSYNAKDKEREERRERIARQLERHDQEAEAHLDWGEDTMAKQEWGSGQQSNKTGAVDQRFRDYYGRNRDMPRPELRDVWLNPMLDTQSFLDVFDPDGRKVEDRLEMEQEVNRWESRFAARYVVIYLIVVPLLVGWAVSRAFFEPILTNLEHTQPSFFDLTDKQKVESARKIHMEEMRVRMNMAIGKVETTSEMQLLVHLHEEAKELHEEELQNNKQGLLNLISDSISGGTLFLSLKMHDFGRRVLSRTIDRFVSSISETAKAFVVILTADILLGYHSEEGWASLINLFTRHYGYEVEEEPVYIFIAIVPVVLDAMFKYWIFNGLNRVNPSSAVTLKEMDRH